MNSSPKDQGPLDDWEPSVQAQVVIPLNPDDSNARYNIIIKRDDHLFRVMSVLNTILFFSGVALIAGIFVLVAFGVYSILDVKDAVDTMRTQ